MAETVRIVRCDHPLVDSGDYFTVDIQTRNISHPNPKSLVLVQGDANSEIYTICIPKLIDNHPVDACNKLEIHYINTGSNSEVLEDIYEISELKEYPDDSENLYAEWILSGNASMYNGNLSFAMRFMCVDDDEDGTILYSWSTLPFTGISIGRTILNAETVYNQYSDIIAQWYNKLTRASDNLDFRINDSISAAKQAIEEKGKVVAGSLSERYKEYGAESYVYYLSFVSYACNTGENSFIVVKDIPISIQHAGQSKYIYARTLPGTRTLAVYIGNDRNSAINSIYPCGYATYYSRGEEALEDVEISFSAQIDNLFDKEYSDTLSVTVGHNCVYESEPDINIWPTVQLTKLDVTNWEVYVNMTMKNYTTFELLELLDHKGYFCIERLKSIAPMVDQATARANQYTDYRIERQTFSSITMTDVNNMDNYYTVFIENGELKVEPYKE